MQPTIPRRGSMQFWPRSRAKRIYPSLNMKKSKNAAQGVFCFAGYKAGMTHVMAIDSGKNSRTKGEEISIPVTILECPPVKVIGFRTYRQGNYGLEPSKDYLSYSDKHLQRKMPSHKKTPSHDFSSIKPPDFSTLTLIVSTQPHLAGISKKTPEVFEMIIGGTNEEKLTFAKENVGKDITLNSVFKEGDVVDVHGVTRGKGMQGPVKRFGVSLRSHKSEKTIRGPGSLGPWSGQQHIMYRVAHAGQTGFHTRTEFNKQILKISSNPEEIAIKGDLMHYGKIKSSFVLFRGSTIGAKKRLVLFTRPSRLKGQLAMPTIQQINLDSKQ